MALTICEKCGEKYPEKMSNCPGCPRTANRPQDVDELVERISKKEHTMKYLFSSLYWESGTDELRQKLQDRRDEMFGRESWPAHIERA